MRAHTATFESEKPMLTNALIVNGLVLFAVFEDGTTQSATLGFTDWTSGSASFGDGTAASMPYRNSAGGSSQQIGTKVFTTNIPLQPGNTVASVTLPSRANQGLLHIFALGTDKSPLTIGG